MFLSGTLLPLGLQRFQSIRQNLSCLGGIVIVTHKTAASGNKGVEKVL